MISAMSKPHLISHMLAHATIRGIITYTWNGHPIAMVHTLCSGTPPLAHTYSIVYTVTVSVITTVDGS